MLKYIKYKNGDEVQIYYYPMLGHYVKTIDPKIKN